jgi:hypothetical protein
MAVEALGYALCPLQGRVQFCEDVGNGGQRLTNVIACKVQEMSSHSEVCK